MKLTRLAVSVWVGRRDGATMQYAERCQAIFWRPVVCLKLGFWHSPCCPPKRRFSSCSPIVNPKTALLFGRSVKGFGHS